MNVACEAQQLVKGDYILVQNHLDPDSKDIMYVEYLVWAEDGLHVDICGYLLWDERSVALTDAPINAFVEVINA